MVFERRKYTRYIVQADTYAAFGPQFTKVGRTKDISIDGLAFEYINKTEDYAKHSNKVTIFLTRDKFFLWNLPCRLVYDIPNNDFNYNQEDSTYYNCRRCGLLFDSINDDHRRSLEYFFSHHTRGLLQTPDYMGNDR